MVDNFNFEPQPVLYSQAVLHVIRADNNPADIPTRPISDVDTPTAIACTPCAQHRRLELSLPFPPMPVYE